MLAQAQMHTAEKPELLRPEVAVQLVARGARIGQVRVVAENVFDLANPKEDKPLYRMANRVHLTTHPGVLENLLLFKTGDLYDPEVLLESERFIRDRGWIADAFIVPSAYHEESNTVDILVSARDAWSLSSNLHFGRSGGENRSGFGFEEKNLFGTGKRLELLHETSIDRDKNILGYADENVLGSWVRLDANYATASDGSSNNLILGRPFFAMDSRWSIDSQFLRDERIDSIYDLGEPIDAFEHRTNTYTIQGGWSDGLIDGRVKRWLVGLTSDEHSFSPTVDSLDPALLPEDRQLVYPWIGFELIGNDFRQFVELNDMGRIEDVQLGLSLNAKLGYSSTQLGADRPAWLLDFSAQNGWQPNTGRLFTMNFAASSRHETTGFTNTIFSTNATYYRKMLDMQMLTVSFDAVATHGLDLDQQILLGGDSGLRGYPLRYQSGTSRALLRVEQRVFTDWYPFHLVRVGYAAFIDAGRTWGEDPRATPSLGMLYDMGFGLRLSSPRSSSGSVVHIDFAVPINGDPSISGLQISVKTRASF